MTEPIAWRAKNIDDDEYIIYDYKPLYFDTVEPLYTSTQLQPRVKMTQAEFDEFKQLIEEHGFVLEALQAIYNGKYKNLNSKLFNGRTVESDNEQVKILTNLMSEFNPNNPEETIDIIPVMKWFVVSKSLDDGVYYVVGEIDNYYPTFNSALNETEVAKFGYPFDTEEEAEKWTNPLTESVQLQVEE